MQLFAHLLSSYLQGMGDFFSALPWGRPGEELLLSPFFSLFQYFLPFSFWLLYIFCNFGALIGEAAYLHTTLVVVTRVAETNAIFAPCSRRALHSREGWWEKGHDIY